MEEPLLLNSGYFIARPLSGRPRLFLISCGIPHPTLLERFVKWLSEPLRHHARTLGSSPRAGLCRAPRVSRVPNKTWMASDLGLSPAFACVSAATRVRSTCGDKPRPLTLWVG